MLWGGATEPSKGARADHIRAGKMPFRVAKTRGRRSCSDRTHATVWTIHQASAWAFKGLGFIHRNARIRKPAAGRGRALSDVVLQTKHFLFSFSTQRPRRARAVLLCQPSGRDHLWGLESSGVTLAKGLSSSPSRLVHTRARARAPTLSHRRRPLRTPLFPHLSNIERRRRQRIVVSRTV